LGGSEEFFRTIFESIHVSIGIFDVQAGEHFTNRATHEILGYSQEELSRTEQWDEIVHPEDRAAGAKRYADLVQGKSEKDEWEQRFIRRDGRIVVSNETCKLIRDARGKPKYVVTLNEDITERRRAAEALTASEQLFRTVFENAQIGIGFFDIKTGKHLSNRAQMEMLGYSQEELSRLEQWDEIVHPDDRATGAKRYAELVQGQRDSHEYTQRFIHRDGRVVTESARFTLIRDTEGNPNYVIALHEDITERLKAEEALAASERFFRTIFENAQIGISIVNVPAKQYHTNRALHQMLGCTHEELNTVEKWDLIVHPNERESGAKRYAELLTGKQDHDEWEQKFVRPDGSIVIANGRFSVIRDAEGKVEYVLNLSEDITERKRAEEGLRHANFLAETALELTKAGYWHVPLDGSGCYISSPRRVALFGDIPNSDYRYRLDEFFTHAEAADKAAANAARKAFSDAVDGKTDIYDAVFAYKRPIDGQVAWGHALGQVVKDRDGKPTDMYGVSQDITEFKLMELMLRDAHETVARQLLAINSELELARQVQQSILPREIPKMKGLEIAARYLPMSSVAGDFYDFLVLDEKHIGILIADVTGHGLPAALIASMLQTALAAQSSHASDPAQVLSKLNQALYGKFQSHYVTAIYLFIDLEKATAVFAGSAHQPLLLWQVKTGKATEYCENGFMLGPFPDSTYTAMSFSLEKGEKIVLLTDGVVETMNKSGSQFGMDRVKRLLESKYDLPANQFADALLYALSDWSTDAVGTGQSDDVTLLVIDFKGSS
jgi:PAS domain S-box-containing protein